jgi:hypothetical protein
MDPVSIFGVAAAAVQFVAFSDALLGGARGVWNVATSNQDRIGELMRIEMQLQSISKDLVAAASSDARPDLHEAEKKLCEDCDKLAKLLLQALDRLIRQKGGKWEKFRTGLLEVWTKPEVDGLVRQLGQFRQQICMSMLHSFRYIYPHIASLVA